MQGVLEGGELPEHMDMEQMMAGMGAMGGMGGGGMPALEGRDWDEYRVTSLEDADVGKIFDCTGGKGLITKKLLEAGERNDFDNPADGWEVRPYSGSASLELSASLLLPHIRPKSYRAGGCCLHWPPLARGHRL